MLTGAGGQTSMRSGGYFKIALKIDERQHNTDRRQPLPYFFNAARTSDSSCACALPSQQAAPFTDSEAAGTQEDQEEPKSIEGTFTTDTADTALVTTIAGAIAPAVAASAAALFGVDNSILVRLISLV